VIVAEVMPPSGGKRRAFVPTMGALHEGHRALMRLAREQVGSDGEVVVSVFVNPLQFGADEDFERYPRTLDSDAAACAAEGVDILYVPNLDQVYGTDPSITVDPGALGAELEGASRPGHFAGVLTVVTILLQQVAPDVAIFGEKDYQQLELIRRLCRDLSLPVTIVGVPTVRENDGLALSSRNRYLSSAERQVAGAIPIALRSGAAESTPSRIRTAALSQLRDPGLDIDYVEVRGHDLGPVPASGEGRLLIAVHVGRTRLIDNCPVTVTSDGAT
jgi:pantoate--beta-alanine ligase